MAKRYQAFTLFEILLVIGIFVLVSAFLVPTSLNQIQGDKLMSTVDNLKSSIYLQQQGAYSGKSENGMGIYLSNTSYYLYEGPSYGEATNTDQVFYKRGVTLSSFTTQDIHFNNGNFKPQQEILIDLGDGVNNMRIRINSEGLIEKEIL